MQKIKHLRMALRKEKPSLNSKYHPVFILLKAYRRPVPKT